MRPIERVFEKEVKSEMKAVIETGGKQYNVTEGDVIYVEKLADAVVGESYTFDKVLAVVDGENSRFGTPVVEGAKVVAKVITNGKAKKIRVFKYNSKKNYRRRQGHRQPFTRLQIEAING